MASVSRRSVSISGVYVGQVEFINGVYYIDDAFFGSTGADEVTTLPRTNVIEGETHLVDSLVRTFEGDDVITAQDGNDTIEGGLGADSIAAGAGNDTISNFNGDAAGAGGYNRALIYQGDSIDGGGGTDRVLLGSLDYSGVAFASVSGVEEAWIGDTYTALGLTVDGGFLSPFQTIVGLRTLSHSAAGGVSDFTGKTFVNSFYNNETVFYGGDGADGFIVDAAFANNIGMVGGGGSDTLRGGAGNDTLNGGTGADLLDGRGGDDWFVASSGTIAGDTLIGGAGTDAVDLTDNGDYTGQKFASVSGVEQVWIGGTYTNYSLTIDGGFLNPFQTIVGLYTLGHSAAGGVSSFVGKTFVNFGGRMYGNVGNDGFIFDDSHLGQLVLYGGDGNDTLTGGAAVDTLYGGANDDRLNGGGGADWMQGEAGADRYWVNDAGDRTIETAGGGSDTVYASISYALAGDADIERLETTLRSGTAALDLTGNDIAQSILGNDGANVLDGRGGADFLYGYRGDDVYRVDNVSDRVYEGFDSGYDQVLASVSWTLAASAYVERIAAADAASAAALNLTGNSVAQTLEGNAGANILSGGGGGDVMRGFAGDDIYRVYLSGDLVYEAAGEGADRVVTRATYSLLAGQEIEWLQAEFAAATTTLYLTGNEFGQRIDGNAGANRIDGRGGADAMSGLAGNDIYFVDDAGDSVIETTGGGVDTVYCQTSWVATAGREIETIRVDSALPFANVDLTGNALAQTLIGSGGANRLDGLGGSDILNGGSGADVYVFSSALSANNIDTIQSYRVADDQIELKASIFTQLGPVGPLAAAALATGAAASTLDHRIVYDAATGALFYDRDGSGAAAQIQFATLSAGLAMTEGEFVIA